MRNDHFQRDRASRLREMATYAPQACLWPARGLSGRPFESIVYTIKSAFRTSPLPYEMQISEVDPHNLRASGRFGLPGASQGIPLIRLLDHFGASGGPWSFLQALWDLFATSWATLEAPPETSWASFVSTWVHLG